MDCEEKERGHRMRLEFCQEGHSRNLLGRKISSAEYATYLGRQEDEYDDEEEAVHRVVHVGQGGRLLQHEGDGGEHCGQHDEERHERADRSVD